MQQNKIAILCTRPLNTILVKEAAAKGITIDELSFIETEPVQTIEVQQEIEQALLLSSTIVFTSMNAVEAVAAWKDEQQPDWNIYSIGTTTHKLAEEYFGADKIAGTANSAAELANVIAGDRFIDEVIFFCGDQRRDELPDILRQNNVEVNEITVYQTIAVPHKITTAYHGILFFSPSAVESFFSNNKIPEQTILFAIGNTTAATIKKFTNNKIIISDAPGKENLVQRMMEYFT
ncbi:uroporphyrinogen-III synthase [Ferruginibacter sp. SUN106]|uniref:uroporphyrinogen-III synthase n=1 Tax=Ferruginibacter sp. SUN106 TaxID=2978348 RepID=UPI003D36ACBE